MSPSEEKLQAFLDLKTPKSKVEVPRICGMAAQMKKFCPGLMLTFPMLQESIKLSPLDVNKRIFCYTDAAVTVGMCYLLLQKTVVSDNDLEPKHGV